ncbi:hypothetical protein Y032_0285g1356 [Ancylostoma ceylanicum]|uniref:Uncharacterized protein n=1 Tax=Ancylostoma ceylanicum TaxID=53326 RepID=A0A016S719_9BILA|nr:hypothetical protein Y032_0285g1356 [Ancylostoma ceylanicum]
MPITRRSANNAKATTRALSQPSSGSAPHIRTKTSEKEEISLVIFRIQFYVKIMQEKKVTSDGIPAFFFEKFADKLCQPLAHIFNISLIVRTVPSL